MKALRLCVLMLVLVEMLASLQCTGQIAQHWQKQPLPSGGIVQATINIADDGNTANYSDTFASSDDYPIGWVLKKVPGKTAFGEFRGLASGQGGDCNIDVFENCSGFYKCACAIGYYTVNLAGHAAFANETLVLTAP